MKLQGWEQRLADYLRDCHSGKIILSRYDCATFAASWVEIATGRTIRHSSLKNNIDRKESLELLAALSIERCVSEILPNVVTILSVSRGDVVLLRQDGLSALGICDGENSYFLHTDRGLNPVPTVRCDVAWSVD